MRRAKLYYLRERRGKKARIKERRVEGEELLAMMNPDAKGVVEAKAQATEEAAEAEDQD